MIHAATCPPPCTAHAILPYHTIPYHTIPYHGGATVDATNHIIPYHTIPYHTMVPHGGYTTTWSSQGHLLIFDFKYNIFDASCATFTSANVRMC